MSETASSTGRWQQFRNSEPPKHHRAGSSLGGRPVHFLVRRGDGDLPSLAKWGPDYDSLYISWEPFTAGVPRLRGIYRELPDLVEEGWQWLALPEGT